MRSFKREIFREIFKLMLGLIVLAEIVLIIHLTIMKVSRFVGMGQRFVKGFSRIVSEEIEHDLSNLEVEVPLSNMVIFQRKDLFNWYVLTVNDVVKLTNIPGLKVGGRFSPPISGEKGATFLKVGGKANLVIYVVSGLKKGYVALNPDRFKKYIDVTFEDTFLIGDNGVVLMATNEDYEGCSISALGLSLDSLKRKNFMGDYKIVAEEEPHGLWIVVRYSVQKAVLKTLFESLPMIATSLLGLILMIVPISRFATRTLTKPIDDLVSVISSGDATMFKTDYSEIAKIAEAINDLVFRFESVHNGLLLVTSYEFKPELEGDELYIHVIKEFEDNLFTMFQRKYIGVAYYARSSEVLKRIEARFREPLVEAPEEMELEVVETILGHHRTAALWSKENGVTDLLIPVRIENDLRFLIVVYLKGDITRTESYAGEALAMEYNIVVNQAYNIHRLNYLATTDFLTGLKNRMYFMTRLEEECKRQERYSSEKPFAVSLIDLDDLKKVNDTYGHEAGDELLKVFAEFLEGITRESDVAGRIGGDEFGVIWIEVDPSDVGRIERRFSEELRKVKLEKYGLALSASIGTAIYGIDGKDKERLLSVADMRMYAMKEEKKRAGGHSQQRSS